ncbi:hypothetical protein BAE44_0025894 [Dichanthelium oligosanthes]|uniref:Pectinesterase n=1 Tax=Dichanthelium oligosanthes TaxID=888268 RepID=A0A1E5UJR3_9POAL|nr:hypothetical protein BAE44_0025894 [Dichanthelium oligosanthes]
MSSRHGATMPAWAEQMLKQQAATPRVHTVVVVAQDGSGDFNTVGAAIAAAPKRSPSRYVIHIKKGTYNEIVRIYESIWNLTLLGDGIGVTIITGSRSVDKFPMRETATLSYVAWNDSAIGLDTLFYGEYKNSGPGSGCEWKGEVARVSFHGCN